MIFLKEIGAFTNVINDTFSNIFRADRSMYHALGYGTIMYLQATLTFEMVSRITIYVRQNAH